MSGIRTPEDLKLRCVVDDITGCWHWRGALANTTPCFRVPQLGRVVAAGVAIGFFRTGEVPERGVVWHRTCRTVLCVCPAHRTQGTRKTQMAFQTGQPKPPLQKARIAATRRAGSAVTEAMVDDIRSSDETAKALAEKHGMSITHACRIRRQETRLPLGLSAFSRWAA